MEEVNCIPEVIKKYLVIATGASFLYPGLGQILCGRITRGIALLFPVFIPQSLYQIVGILGAIGLIDSIASFYQSFNLLNAVVYLILRIWATYDAYRISTELNRVPC